MIDFILISIATTKYNSWSFYLPHLSYRFSVISSWYVREWEKIWLIRESDCLEAGQYSCFFVYLRLVSIDRKWSFSIIRYVYRCWVFLKMKSLILLHLSAYFHVLLKWIRVAFCWQEKGEIRFCLDASFGSSTKIFRCQGNDYVWIVLSNCTTSGIRNRDIELVKN